MHLNEKSMQSGNESLILFSIFNSINKVPIDRFGSRVWSQDEAEERFRYTLCKLPALPHAIPALN